MREIETQPLGVHQRTLLLHMITQHRAQSRMEQMRCTVTETSALSHIRIDVGRKRVTALYAALQHFYLMQVMIRGFRCR